MQISLTGIETKWLMNVVMLRVEKIVDVRNDDRRTTYNKCFPAVLLRLDDEELALRDVLTKLRKAQTRKVRAMEAGT